MTDNGNEDGLTDSEGVQGEKGYWYATYEKLLPEVSSRLADNDPATKKSIQEALTLMFKAWDKKGNDSKEEGQGADGTDQITNPQPYNYTTYEKVLKPLFPDQPQTQKLASEILARLNQPFKDNKQTPPPKTE